MRISILKHKTHTNDTIVRNIDNFEILKTGRVKGDAPLWNLTYTPNRKNDPLKVSGIIIDYDDYTLSPLGSTIKCYHHKTHSSKYRIIVPFDQEYDFAGPIAYKEEYMHVLSLVLGSQYQDLFTKINKDKGTVLQHGCCSHNRWFYMRPKDQPLLCNDAPYHRPSFKMKDIQQTKKTLQLRCGPVDYEFKSIEIKKSIIYRMFHFYSYYAETIDWALLDSKGYCIFDWHPNTPCGSLFNYPTETHKAAVVCKHDSCYGKLKDYCYRILDQDVSEKKDSGSTFKIKSATVLYLAAAILKGVWAIEWVEMMIFKQYPILADRIDRLQFLRFDPKIDAPSWMKIYHKNIIMEPQSLRIYDYETNVYTLKSTENITHEYEHTIGTYYGYRTACKKSRPAPKNYVDSLVRYTQACMLANYHSVRKVDHLNLRNGLLIFDISSGDFHFQSHDRHILSKRQVDYEYDPDAACPLWLNTLQDYFGTLKSPQVTMLQEYFGYCLTYDRSLEKLLFLFGASRGGKGTIAHVLQHLVWGGRTNVTENITMDYFLDPEERSTLIEGKKMIFIDELPNFSNKNVISELKRISSNNGLDMRVRYCQPYTEYDVPKLVIAFNKLPSNFEIDTALKNRMLSLKFKTSFQGRENINLKVQLVAELPGILSWALIGYRRIYKNARFTQYSNDTMELYNTANESKHGLLEFLTHKKKEQVLWSTKELLSDYQEISGEFKLSQSKFYGLLKEFNVIRKTISGYRHYHLGNV